MFAETNSSAMPFVTNFCQDFKSFLKRVILNPMTKQLT